MVPFLVILDLGTNKKQLSWRKSSLSMLLGADWVCSTKGHHGHLCNGCKVHRPGWCLCGNVQLWRVIPGALFQHSGVRWSVPRDGPILSTCTTCPANAMALLLASSFFWQPSSFKEIPLDILIQMCLYDLNSWSWIITCTSSQDQAFDFGIGNLLLC